jgi:hypothetical protein
VIRTRVKGAGSGLHLRLLRNGAQHGHSLCTVAAQTGRSCTVLSPYGWACITSRANRAFRIGLTRFRLQQQVPSRLYHYPATPPLANDTISDTTPDSGISIANPYRYHRYQPSSQISSQNGWRRQRYALTPGRAVAAGRLMETQERPEARQVERVIRTSRLQSRTQPKPVSR